MAQTTENLTCVDGKAIFTVDYQYAKTVYTITREGLGIKVVAKHFGRTGETDDMLTINPSDHNSVYIYI